LPLRNHLRAAQKFDLHDALASDIDGIDVLQKVGSEVLAGIPAADERQAFLSTYGDAEKKQQ